MPHPLHLRRSRTACLAALVATAGLSGGVALVPASAGATPVAAVASAGTVPSAPLGVTARQTAAGQVTMTWRPPTTAGSSPITSYEPGFSAGQFGNGRSVAATERSVVFGNLTKGSYSFSVAAASDAGWGARVFVPVRVTTSAPAERAPVVTVSESGVVSGSSLTISGTSTPGTTLSLERALPGGSYRWFAGITTDRTGAFTDTRVVRYTAYYRIRTETGVLSTAHRVAVRNRMEMAAASTGPLAVTLSGTVYPVSPGQSVRLAWLQADGTFTRLADVVTDANGHWAFPRDYRTARTMTFRATSAATTANTAGSTTLDVEVQ